MNGDLGPGSVFAGRFEILRTISQGDLAAVFMARDITRREVVALKVLFHGQVKSPATRERFRNEFNASRQLQHPNIVRGFEYIDEVDSQALVMEYVDGGDLSQYLPRAPLTDRVVADMMRQVASGLEVVHAAGIVHRDLKPENILMSRDGTLKISDFGLARLRGGSTLTQTGMMVGTPKYISPEYVETGECDHRADIYALGVIAYELLSGVSPLPNDRALTSLAERLKRPPTPLVHVAPRASKKLVSLIEKAMSFQLARRYQSAADLGKELDTFLAHIESNETPKQNVVAPPSNAGARRTTLVDSSDRIGRRATLTGGIRAHQQLPPEKKEPERASAIFRRKRTKIIAGLLFAMIAFVMTIIAGLLMSKYPSQAKRGTAAGAATAAPVSKGVQIQVPTVDTHVPSERLTPVAQATEPPAPAVTRLPTRAERQQRVRDARQFLAEETERYLGR